MAYVVPQVLVFQDFNIRALPSDRRLSAYLTGPHAELYRYSEADEKAVIGLGTYDNVGASVDGEFKTCYSWPEKASSSLIDTDYTKVYLEDALLRYWLNSGAGVRVGANKIRWPAKNFKSNGGSYPRSNDFLDRDVKVGDIVRVTGYVSGEESDSFQLSTYVKALEADESDPVINAAEAGDNNVTGEEGGYSFDDGTSNEGTATIDSVNVDDWDGRPNGLSRDVYTLEVIQSSDGSDQTTALIRITSASGKDDVASVAPPAAGDDFAIGSTGAVIVFDPGTLVVGDTFTVRVYLTYTPTTAISGGDYTGDRDRTYIVEVTKGGDYAAIPEITVRTTDGTDASGPHKVYDLWGSGTPTTSTTSTSLDPEAAQTITIPIGNYGVTISFTGLGLMLGDRFTITATAPSPTNYRTLVLGHDLDSDIPYDSAADSAFEVALYIKKDLQLTRKHASTPGQYNWEQSNTQICLFAGVEAYDDSWTDGGVPAALPVITDEFCPNTNKLYVEFRAWNQELTTGVYSITDVADLDDAVSGPLHPDNPLKWALFKALSNNNNVPVFYMAVSDPADLDDWSETLSKIEDRDDVYGLVPLTTNASVIDLFVAHAQSQSSASAGRWRVVWANLTVDSTGVVGNETTEGEQILVTTADDPGTSGTQYTIFNGTSGHGFFANARVGDTIRYRYDTDEWDETTYESYTIAEILSDDSVRCETGTTAAESTPLLAEIWRTRTVAEQATAIATKAGAYGSSRVRAVWPDTISSGGTSMAGYHLCAALAALSGGVAPHQGLTHLSITGFDDVSRTTKFFSATQLNTMAAAGVWIVTQQPQTGTVFSRHALTTGDNDDVNQREEMVIRNVDSISYQFMDAFAPYIGIANVTDSMLTIIESETLAMIQSLRSSGATARLGGQLIDGTITQLRRHATLLDRIVLGLSLNIPYALNNLEIHLVI